MEFFGLDSVNQGIVHIIGPQLGLTQPGMTLACGDSHTSTHGAFGTLAFGIGTSQVRDVLATQTLAMDKLKVRRVNVNGALGTGVYAKDVIFKHYTAIGCFGRQRLCLRIWRRGHRHDEHGRAHDSLQHEHRGRGFGRLRQSRSDDLRLSQGTPLCADRARHSIAR